MRPRIPHVLLALALVASAARAQTGASFKLEEHVLNQGGHPADGTILTSTQFRMTIDSIGEGMLARGLSGSTYRMDGGFVPAYRPPGEVMGLVLLADDQTLAWDAHPSAGAYNLYRDLIGSLAPDDLGDCLEDGIAAPTTTDPATPSVDMGYFYLVTVDNRLGEEGGLGAGESGERENLLGTPCP